MANGEAAQSWTGWRGSRDGAGWTALCAGLRGLKGHGGGAYFFNKIK